MTGADDDARPRGHDNPNDVDFRPFLTQLEQPYDPDVPPEVDGADLIRFAFSVSNYWADRALDWLEFGFPPAPVKDDLRALVDDRRRPQPLRHRALRVLKTAGLL